MQIGDIVEIGDWKGASKDSRKCGKILKMDGHHSWSAKKEYRSSLTEVLWQNGKTGWVATNRLRKITP